MDVLSYIEKNQKRFCAQLIDLCKIPSISRFESSWGEIDRSARLTARFMKEAGLERVEVIPFKGGPPYVYGEWLKAGVGKPTVLLYAHHDVQPVGDELRWSSDPFKAVVCKGRLYGRGTVDDKSGIVIHLAAISAYLKTVGQLPVNIKFVVEGDEESGSRTLVRFLKRYQKRLRSDLLCLTDCSNLETGLPSLTYSLRGLASVHVRVRTLRGPVHSGMWGGLLPDAPMVLSKLLASLMDDQGKVLVKGFYNDVQELSNWERQQLASLPWNKKNFLQEGGAVKGLRLIGDATRSPYESLWSRPTLSVLAVEGSRLEGAPNQIVPSAEAIISCRTVPNQNPVKIQLLLGEHLQRNLPFGAELHVRPVQVAPYWKTVPQGPYFDAARRALSKGFGREPVLIGCGGSIPFVHYFQEVFGNLPSLLLGLEDPPCNAHGEDESLSLADFEKGIRSTVYLYREIAAC